jgi:hypothetical protein
MVGHGWRRLLGARDEGAWVAGAAEQGVRASRQLFAYQVGRFGRGLRVRGKWGIGRRWHVRTVGHGRDCGARGIAVAYRCEGEARLCAEGDAGQGR